MVMNHMAHFVKQITGKLSPNVYSSVLNQTDPGHIAFLRQLQRELKSEDILEIPFASLKLVVFDIETTGFYPHKGDRILSLGAVRLDGLNVLENESFYSLVYSDQRTPEEIQELTGITDEQLKEAPQIEFVLKDFYEFIQKDTLIAHHANHEKNFMQHVTWSILRTNFKHRIIDTSFLTQIIQQQKNMITLDDCCSCFGINVEQRHHALHDAIATAKVWSESVKEIEKLGFLNLKDVYSHLAKLK
jgi:DNA polymerase-3 subunit epsilon